MLTWPAARLTSVRGTKNGLRRRSPRGPESVSNADVTSAREPTPAPIATPARRGSNPGASSTPESPSASDAAPSAREMNPTSLRAGVGQDAGRRRTGGPSRCRRRRREARAPPRGPAVRARPRATGRGAWPSGQRRWTPTRRRRRCQRGDHADAVTTTRRSEGTGGRQEGGGGGGGGGGAAG